MEEESKDFEEVGSESELEEENETDEESGEDSNTTVVVNANEKKGIKVSVVVFAVVLILILGIFFVFKNMMPDILMMRGDNCMKKGEYQKALNMYSMVANMKPLATEPVVAQVSALAKLPSTYENQKLLYEISQYDDFDEATEAAERVLAAKRDELNFLFGSSFIDNVLYEDQLVRWNNSEPITYSVMTGGDYSLNNKTEAIKEAVTSWSGASGGLVTFRDTFDNKSANIVIHLGKDIPAEKLTGEVKVATSVPVMNENVLERVDIYVNPYDAEGNEFDDVQMYNIVQHQVGHALGLWGHSADENDVMALRNEYPYQNGERNIITSRDLNTLNAIYKMVPDVIDKPLTQDQIKSLYYHRILTAYPGKNFEYEIARLIEQLKYDRKNIVAWVDLAINYAYTKQYERSNHILKNILPLVGEETLNGYQNVEDTPLNNHFIVLYNMAANYYKLKQYETAKRYLKYANEFGDDLDAQILYAFLDYKLGDIDNAEKELKILQRNNPDNVEIALKLAEICFVKKDKKGEQEVIDELLRNNPSAKKDRRVAKYKEKRNNDKYDFKKEFTEK